jgi:hypothetical protein
MLIARDLRKHFPVKGSGGKSVKAVDGVSLMRKGETKRLNDELDAKDLQLRQKIQEAEEWAGKYREVNQQLTDARHALVAKGEDTTLPLVTGAGVAGPEI